VWGQSDYIEPTASEHMVQTAQLAEGKKPEISIGCLRQVFSLKCGLLQCHEAMDGVGVLIMKK